MRTIIEEKDVEKYVNNNSSDPKFEEVWKAITWKVARSPESGTEIEDAKRIMVSDEAAKNFPIVSIAYTYNDKYVNIWGVKMWEHT